MTTRATGFCVGLVTCPSRAEAEKLAQGILENRLAACVNVLDGVSSFFWWEGKIGRAQECLLVIKTVARHCKDLQNYVRGHHSYEVPEVIFLDIREGHGPYLKWISESVKGVKNVSSL